MATDLGSAYVQIVPSAKGISGSISKLLGGEVDSAGRSAGSSLGASLVSALSGALAAAGIGKIIGSALSAGADLQQSFGGLDTIYDGAQESAKQFAKEAYKAGVSANNYAEQAVSMGASLKQALGGDSTKAINMANVAIMDMTDNAAKMGTDIGVIQQTYQSLARGNYAMLDNLKLGFGGTKSEMERLLTTAEGLPSAMGRKFDISNYADVVEAIHLVQESMGLTGVAAAEAENTYTGSLAAMKASWANTLAGLSLGENITPQLQALASTTSNFLFGNFIPMVGNIFKGLPSAIGTFIAEASPLVAQQFQGLFSSLGMSVDLSSITLKFQGILTAFQPVMTGLQTAFGQLPGFFSSIGAEVGAVITTIMDGIARMDFSGFQSLISAILPALQAGFQTFMSIVGPAIDSVINSFVNMWNAAQPLITILSGALMPVLQILGSFLGGILKGVLSGVSFAFDALKVAIEFLTPVVDFLVQALNFVQPVLSTIAEWIGVAIGMFGNLGTAGQGLSAFIKSAWTNIQSAIQTAGNIIRTVIDWIKLAFSGAGNAVGVLKNVFSLAWMGIQDAIRVAKGVIDGVISGIKGAFRGFQSVVSSVGGAVGGVIGSITSTIKGLANIDISGAGAAIMNGFLGGLKSAWGAVTDFVGGIAGWIAENKGPISYDRVLLKPAGLAIMEGLNTNLKVGFKDVMGTVSGMAGAIAKPFENQSLAYDMTSSASVDVRRNLLSSTGDFAGSDGGSSLSARLANIERFLSALVDKELAVYLDGEKLAQNSYMHQGAIMAREGI
ncbi:phage tail protein [Streptococcus suis]|uniref:Phage protein n=3 Tax=Streptococcus suis TaxID=1307 RepID=A0A822VHA4_STRSU|nr:phage tail protein [Streptococcus suis]QBX21685.1 minor tail protein [Streptococcus phage Javan589]AGZ23750.1 putative phage tail protein [Streptococcus suis T15]MCB2956751.1 phage tail protein [Streptococcus suis]MCB2964460.1 phage tail protein [Streptococcus suis]MCG9883930.1 phage tail protein [Streptococcus suis]